MKASTAFLFFVSYLSINSTLTAQEVSRFYVGAFGDAHLVHVDRLQTNDDDAFARKAEVTQAFGGGEGIIGLLDLSSQIAISGTLSYIVDRTNSWITTYDDYPFGKREWEERTKYTWIDFSTVAFYKPVQNEIFALSVGAGFSVRRLINLSIDGDIIPNYVFDATDFAYTWNYFLPLSTGVEFPTPAGNKIVCQVGFQFGLRNVYKPYEFMGGFVFLNGKDEYNYKMHSTTVRVGYVFGTSRKSTKKK